MLAPSIPRFEPTQTPKVQTDPRFEMQNGSLYSLEAIPQLANLAAERAQMLNAAAQSGAYARKAEFETNEMERTRYAQGLVPAMMGQMYASSPAKMLGIEDVFGSRLGEDQSYMGVRDLIMNAYDRESNRFKDVNEYINPARAQKLAGMSFLSPELSQLVQQHNATMLYGDKGVGAIQKFLGQNLDLDDDGTADWTPSDWARINPDAVNTLYRLFGQNIMPRGIDLGNLVGDNVGAVMDNPLLRAALPEIYSGSAQGDPVAHGPVSGRNLQEVIFGVQPAQNQADQHSAQGGIF